MIKYLLTLFLIANTALAGLPPTSTQGQYDASSATKFNFQVPYNQYTNLGGVKAYLDSGNRNLLVNSSFEHTTFDTGWTTAAGTQAKETTIIHDGKQSAKITASSQTSTFTQDVTPSVYTLGTNYEASCWVNTTLTNVQVCSRTGAANSQCVAAPSSGNWALVTAAVAGPANGTSVGVQVSMTGSGTGSFYVDDCYVGQSRQTATGFMNTDWSTQYSFTPVNFGTLGTNVWYSRRVGDSLQVRGVFTAGTQAASTASITLPTTITIDSTKLSSGTNTVYLGTINVLNSVSAKTWGSDAAGAIFYDGSTNTSVFMADTTSSAQYVKSNANSFNNNNSVFSVEFTIPITGWTSSQAAYKADMTPANWSGYHTVSGGCSTASTTYADTSACTSIALTELKNRNFGTVTTAASSLPGITFTPPRLGNYLVCASVQLSTTLLATDSARLTDGTNIINQGKSVTISAAGDGSVTVCGVEPVTAAGAITVKIQLAASTSTNAIVNGAATNSSAIDWSVVELDAPMPAPYLTGSVTTSSTTSSEHIERASVANGCSSGTCALTAQGSTPGISSVTFSATGDYIVNFLAGTFSVGPTCICGTYDTGLNFASAQTTASTSSMHCKTNSSGGSATNLGFNVICMGPR